MLVGHPSSPRSRPRIGVPARFHLDGVPAPLTARVTSRDEGGLTLRQELPFLRLERRMRDDRGRRAALSGVSVSVRAGTPSLVLDFRYEDAEEDATTPFGVVDPYASMPAEGREPTQPYSLERPIETDPAPAAPLAPLRPQRAPWHRALWLRLRAFF